MATPAPVDFVTEYLDLPQIFDTIVKENREPEKEFQSWLDQCHASVSNIFSQLNQVISGSTAVFTVEQNIAPGPTYQLIISAQFSDGAQKSITLTLT